MLICEIDHELLKIQDILILAPFFNKAEGLLFGITYYTLIYCVEIYPNLVLKSVFPDNWHL